jgi:hypothetical protein
MPDEQPKQMERCPRVSEEELSCLDIWRLNNIASNNPVTRVPNELMKNLVGDCRELQWKLLAMTADRDRLLALVRSKHPVTAADDAAERLRGSNDHEWADY